MKPKRIIICFEIPAAPLSLFFSSLFWFYSPWLYCFDSLSLLSKCCFCPQQAALLQWRNLSNLTVEYEHNTVQFTDTVSAKLVNVAGHSAAKERDTAPVSWWKIPKKNHCILNLYLPGIQKHQTCSKLGWMLLVSARCINGCINVLLLYIRKITPQLVSLCCA